MIDSTALLAEQKYMSHSTVVTRIELTNTTNGEMEKKRDRKSLVANRRVLDWFENNSFSTL